MRKIVFFSCILALVASAMPVSAGLDAPDHEPLTGFSMYLDTEAWADSLEPATETVEVTDGDAATAPVVETEPTETVAQTEPVQATATRPYARMASAELDDTGETPGKPVVSLPGVSIWRH